ncbi:MAG: hypothetical protein GKR89_29160 [Candidatus Latescibacteria bacterium]|nr:hypothetical protein [Candidatus Latescibacterota bacterium]
MKGPLGLLALLLCHCNPQTSTPPAPVFVDRTEAAGIDFVHRSGERIKNYIVEAKGGGGAWLDYDGDGYLDIYLTNGARLRPGPGPAPTNALYRNQGNGTFTEVTQKAGVGDTAWGMGSIAADCDNDGDQDLYLTNYGPNRLYRNKGNGTFADGAVRAGVALPDWSTGATFGDYDGDGDLDLYVAQYVEFSPATAPPRGGMWKGTLVFAGPVGLPAAADALFRNEGDGTFTQVSQQANVAPARPGYGLDALFADFDDDGDADLYVANDSVANFLFVNQGNGTFIETARSAGAALSGEGTPQAGMGLAYADWDNDGDQDYLVTHFEDDYNTLYRNLGGGFFTVASAAVGLDAASRPPLGFGACFLDWDNDGDQDLAVANGHVYPQTRHLNTAGYAQANQLFANQGRKAAWRLVETPAGDFNQAQVSRGLARADWDDDGDLDLLVVNLDGPPSLLRNDGGNAYNYLRLRLQGRTSNRDAIGAKISARAGDLTQTFELVSGGGFLSSSAHSIHIGLARHQRLDQLEIRWPSGAVQHLQGVAANQTLILAEPPHPN